MAVNFDELFNKVGATGGILNLINVFRGTTIPAKTDALADFFDGNDRQLRDNLYASQTSFQGSMSGYPSYMSGLASSIIIEMVNDDNPQEDLGIFSALQELIVQMIDNSQTVNQSVVGSSFTADAGNNGDATIVISTKTRRGEIAENVFAEDVVVTVTGDAQSGGAEEGIEALEAKGEWASTDPLNSDWPQGSASQASLNAISPDGSTTFLVNGDFENFTANAPDDWTIDVGSAGVSIKSTATAFTGVKALEYVGDGAELTSIYQAVTLEPLTQYALNCWLRVDAVPAAGVLQFALTDGTGTIVNDEQGVANSFTKSLPGATTGYLPVNGVFRTPRVMPAATRIRLKLTTALTTGRSVYVDRLCFADMTTLYTQGPYLAVFSGATPLIVEDFYTVTFTNTPGGFQQLFDKYFGMKSLGLLLPSTTGAETQPDSKIA